MTVSKPKLIKGIKNARYVVLDPVTGLPPVEGGVIKQIPTLRSAKITKDNELTEVWWDDELQETVSSGLMKPSIESTFVNFTPEFYKDVLGFTGEGANTDETGSEEPKAIALMFDVTNEGGSKTHHTYYKVKVSNPDENYDGKTGGAFKEQLKTIKMTYMFRSDVGLYSTKTESDGVGFDLRAQEIRAFGTSEIPVV